VPLAALLRLCLLFLFLIPVAATVLLGAHIATKGSRFARIGLGVLGVAAVVLILPLLWNVPDIDTFGFRSDLGIGVVCWLAGSRPGTGIYVAMLGLLIVACAAAMGSLVEPVAQQAQQDESDALLGIP
jgi:hypothetical protein